MNAAMRAMAKTMTAMADVARRRIAAVHGLSDGLADEVPGRRRAAEQMAGNGGTDAAPMGPVKGVEDAGAGGEAPAGIR